MSSKGGSSRNSSEDEDDEDEDQSEGDNSENEDEDEEDDEEGKSKDQKHVSFKETPIEQIKSVQFEVNAISSNLDLFLSSLNRDPSISYKQPWSNSHSPYQQQKQNNFYNLPPAQSFYAPQYPPSVKKSPSSVVSANASRVANPAKSIQYFSVPSVGGSNEENNKFFYNKKDMSQAKMSNYKNIVQTSEVAAKNYQSQLFASNMMAAGLIDDPSQNKNLGNKGEQSKYNYYGSYRFQSDRDNKSSIFPLQQANKNISSYSNNGQEFKQNMNHINDDVDVLAKSIHFDSRERPIQQGGINPQLYRRVNDLQLLQNGGGLLEKPTPIEQGERRPFSQSSRSSGTQRVPQNVKELYKQRPKRIIDESELYGEIRQVSISNKQANQLFGTTDVQRSGESAQNYYKY